MAVGSSSDRGKAFDGCDGLYPSLCVLYTRRRGMKFVQSIVVVAAATQATAGMTEVLTVSSWAIKASIEGTTGFSSTYVTPASR